MDAGIALVWLTMRDSSSSSEPIPASADSREDDELDPVTGDGTG